MRRQLPPAAFGPFAPVEQRIDVGGRVGRDQRGDDVVRRRLVTDRIGGGRIARQRQSLAAAAAPV